MHSNYKTKYKMKRFILLAALFGTTQITTAQEPVTISNEGVNEVWYSLSNDDQGSSPMSEWDIAFDLSPQDASIRLNDAYGLELYPVPDATGADWATIDTTGLSEWEKVYNSDTEWRMGAFNQTKDPFYPQPLFDYGWGTYDMNTHNVVGTRVFVIKLKDGSFKKLWIEEMTSSNGGKYTFKYANLDGTEETEASIEKTDYANKHFAYYSIQNNEAINHEALEKDQWDLLFAKYITVVTHPVYNVTMPYAAPGVIINPNVTVAEVENVSDVDAYDDWFNQEYTSDFNAIGWEWEDYNWGVGGEHIFAIKDDLVYFLKDQNSTVWKLVFTSFDSPGDYGFTKEMVSTLSVDENDINKAEVVIYPNPASTHFSLILSNMAENNANVQVLNTMGQLVYNKDFTGNTNFEVKNIAIDNLKSGVYFVKVNSGDQTVNQKLIIK